MMRGWMLLVAVILVTGALFGCAHNPNHDIDMEQARAAADRVHKPPPPGTKMEPGAGG